MRDDRGRAKRGDARDSRAQKSKERPKGERARFAERRELERAEREAAHQGARRQRLARKPASKGKGLKEAPASRTDGKVRLNRFLSQCGVASRRKADELISSGKVTVNGETVRELGTAIDPRADRVKVKNRAITLPHQGVVLFYKPRGVVSTLSDPEGRPSIADYMTKHYRSYYPVGRLDYDSSGLIILTNDGDLADRLMHPRFGHQRVYLARVEGAVSDRILDKLRRGVRLQDGIARAEATIVRPPNDARRKDSKEPASVSTWLEIVVLEGRNRIVRRMMEEVGHQVVKLRRISHGPFNLGKLKPGQMRQLTEKEFDKARRSVMEFEPRLDPAERRDSEKA